MRIVLALALLATSCTSTLPEDRVQQVDDTPRRGGRLVVASTRDIATLQPILAGELVSQNVIDRIYAGLLGIHPDTGELVAGLAERHDVSADGLTFSYTLRSGLVWSDGQPLTAEDAKYAAEARARSKRAGKGALEDVVGYADYVEGRAREISGVRVSEDGRRLAFQVRRSTCTSARALAGLSRPIPRHIFGRDWQSATLDRDANLDASPYNLAPPVASGPFQLKEHRPGVQITLVRNDRYYLGAPLVDELIFKIYADAQAIKAALLVGELTWASVPPDAAEEIRASPAGAQLRLREARTNAGYLALRLNQRSPETPWLSDRRVRQALWYGLNIDEIVTKVLRGHAHRVFAHTPQASWAYDAEGLQRYPFDPQRARRLIESAGATIGPDGIYRWTDGRPMRIRIETSKGDTLRETILQIAQEQYRAIGIEVDPWLTSFQALVARLNNDVADVQAMIIGTGPSADPDDAYFWWHSSQAATGSNVFGFRHPVADGLLEAARTGPDCSTATRKKAYVAVDRILNEEAPFVFLFSTYEPVFERTELVAPPPRAWVPWHDVQKWWLRQ